MVTAEAVNNSWLKYLRMVVVSNWGDKPARRAAEQFRTMNPRLLQLAFRRPFGPPGQGRSCGR